MGWFATRRIRGPDPRSLHGPARLQAAIPLLYLWAEHPENLPEVWDRWELPLLEALPDCPPGMKTTLADALDTCANACAHRDTARRIITLRNGLLS